MAAGPPPAPPFLGTKSAEPSPPAGGGEAFPPGAPRSGRRGEAGGTRLFVLRGQAASFPPAAPHGPSIPRGRPPPPFPPNRQRRHPRFLLSPGSGGAAGAASPPHPHEGPPGAPGRPRGFTHLPAGRPVCGTPAPRLVPRQRLGPPRPASSPLRRVRPLHALPSERTRAAARPDPSPAAARTARAAGVAVFYLVDNAKGEQRGRIPRAPKRGAHALKGRPARCPRPPFCAAGEEAAWARRPF